MEKIMNFIKNKSVGYFIAAGVALLSLIVAIVFFAVYRNPDLATQMGNKAEGWVADTIGIFLLAGFLVEVAVLVLPEYRFIQIIATVMYAFAFVKEVLIIPDFLAGLANGVMYNGGNLGFNFFLFFALLIIVVASIVPAFMGFYKKEEDATADMPIKGTPKIVRLSCGAVAVVVALLVSTITTSVLTNGTGKKGGNGSSQQRQKVDPITEKIKAAANAVEYAFNPESVIIKQKENYVYKAADAEKGYFNEDYPSLSAGAATRSGHDLVYLFEGIFSEGYHGGYGTYSANLYLWDDGLFTGKSNNNTFKGYWYNSSIEYGKNEEGEDIEDCLNMFCLEPKKVDSNTGEVTEYVYENFKSIITDAVKGFYSRQGYVYLNPGWGGRSVVVSGYKYYPDVAMFVDTNEKTEFKVGDTFNREMDWAANKVIKNLNYTPIMDVDAVKWTYPEGMLDENNKFVAAGEYEITAKWNNFEDTVKIKVAA